MLKKGEYKIIDLLCITKPLLNQTHQDSKIFDVYKSVLERDGKNHVVYFLDDIEIGQNSIIWLKEDLNTTILYKNNYDVLQKTEYKINTDLIETLISKNK